MREYRDAVSQFCTRILEYLDIAFKHQSDATLADYKKRSSETKLSPHTTLGENLMSYEGLVLFVKDMDDDRYKKMCLVSLSARLSTDGRTTSRPSVACIRPRWASSSSVSRRILALRLNGRMSVSSSPTAELTMTAFSKALSAPPPKLGAIGGAVARSKTLKKPSGQDKAPGGKKADRATVKVSEAYAQAMTEIVGQIVTEDDFINAFLHLADQESTFADYMQLDTYFRRQATRHASRNNPSLAQIARSVMDLMFGFVDANLQHWCSDTLKIDLSAVVGLMAVTEQFAEQAEAEGTSLFLTDLFDKQLQRHRLAFDHFIVSHRQHRWHTLLTVIERPTQDNWCSKEHDQAQARSFLLHPSFPRVCGAAGMPA